VTIVGDRTGRLKAWFDIQKESVIVLRPDHCIAGASIAQLAPELSTSIFDVLTLTPGGNRAARPVLHVPQPAAESARAVAGPPG
jgi:3-(3-hydroxy-phenyl)propionate hydroxylase